MALLGASDTVSMVTRDTIQQLRTSDYIRGRITSVNQIFFTGAPYLSNVKDGFLGGVRCVASVGWITRQWPALRRYDSKEETTPA